MPNTEAPHPSFYHTDFDEPDEEGLMHGVDCNCPQCVKDIATFEAKKAQRAARKAKRETGVEATFVKEQEAQGKLVLKVKVLGRPGYPDRWVLGSIDDAVRVYTTEMFGANVEPSKPDRELVTRIVAAAFSMAELKKQKQSRFQPKQKTIIPMLRERGFKVDIKHG